jgi:hypothetical protein
MPLIKVYNIDSDLYGLKGHSIFRSVCKCRSFMKRNLRPSYTNSFSRKPLLSRRPSATKHRPNSPGAHMPFVSAEGVSRSYDRPIRNLWSRSDPGISEPVRIAIPWIWIRRSTTNTGHANAMTQSHPRDRRSTDRI